MRVQRYVLVGYSKIPTFKVFKWLLATGVEICLTLSGDNIIMDTII